MDATRFPLVVHTLDGKQTDEDVDAYLQEAATVFARRQPFVAITYVKDYAMVWSHIARLGTQFKRMAVEYCKASAIVVPFPTFRFVLSSYYLIHVPPHPVVVFDHAQPAEAWIVQKLKEEGLPVPPSLRAAG